MFTWLDVIWSRFSAWRAGKAGADLGDSEAQVSASEKAAAEIVAKLSEPPKPPAVVLPALPVPVKP